MANSCEVVRIRVKSASHRCEDIEISCQVGSSVRDVKEIIKDQYPLHPEIKEQRIIYAGHLLEDEQILREIFAQGGQISTSGGYTFHLACNSTFIRKTNQATTELPKAVHSEECSGTERRLPPQNPQTGAIPQDMLALHQLYVEQMMNFMSQWNQGAMAPVWMSSPMPPMVQGARVSPDQQHMPRFQQAQAPPNADHPPLQEQAVRPNEPPADPVHRIHDDDEQPFDLLEWIYTCGRLFLILSIVFFYSNLTRFILVLLFTTVVMLAQRRPGFLNAFRAQAQEPAQEQEPQRNANPPQAPGEEPLTPNASTEGLVEGEGEEETNSEGMPPSPPEELLPAAAEAQQEQQRLHPFDITRTFLMTFFTSLIPEINPN